MIYKNRIVGEISARLGAPELVMRDDKTTSITSVMTPLPIELPTGRQNDNVDSILNTMKEKNKGCAGIVTVTDLARRMYEQNKEDPCLYAIARSRFLHNK